MAFQPSTHYMNAFGAATYSAATGFPAIKEGAKDADTGYAVTTLAGNLRSQTYEGHNDSPLDYAIKTGTFTPGLTSQVKKFQAAKGLKADGIVGAGTWKALGVKSVASEKKYTSYTPPAVTEKPPVEEKKSFWANPLVWAGGVAALGLTSYGVYWAFFKKV